MDDLEHAVRTIHLAIFSAWELGLTPDEIYLAALNAVDEVEFYEWELLEAYIQEMLEGRE